MSAVATASSGSHAGGGAANWRSFDGAVASSTIEAAMFVDDDDEEVANNNTNNGSNSNSKHDFDDDFDEFDALQVKPSTLEVDYDKNLTELYQAITDQNWKRAAFISHSDPIQAAIWVVRHYQDDDDDDDDTDNVEKASSRHGRSTMDDEDEPEIMWRFLPLHSACARQPPVETIAALVKAYPDAAKCVDDQGMYALHYACGNQADPAVIRLLLATFPRAAAISDPRGMLPLHYATCWGPSFVSVIEALLMSNAKAATTRDNDGNMPLDLAMDGDYPEKNAVAETLRKWIRTHRHGANTNVKSAATKAAAAASTKKEQTVDAINKAAINESKKKELSQQLSAMRMMISHSNSSHGTDYNDAIVIDNVEATRLDEAESPIIEPSTTKARRSVSSNMSTASVSSSVVAAAAAPTPRLSNNSTPSPPETRQGKQSVRSKTPPPKTRDPVHDINSPARSIETVPSHSSIGSSPVKFSSALSALTRKDQSGATTNINSNARELVNIAERAVESVQRSVSNKGKNVEERLVDDDDRSLVESLQRKVREQENEMKVTIEKLFGVQKELTEKNTTLEIVERDLESTKNQLETCRSECNGLRGTLGDMMDQHETVKRKSGNTSDRLGALSISLDSMMEQQTILTKTVKERNENYKSKFLNRQELFEQLMMMDKEVEESEGKLDASLKKQTREMEAIAAVIKAALD